MRAIEKANTARFELRETSADGDEIGVHQFDERSAQEKIETDEGDHRGRIVEHASGGFLYAATLLDEISFQKFAEAAESF